VIARWTRLLGDCMWSLQGLCAHLRGDVPVVQAGQAGFGGWGLQEDISLSLLLYGPGAMLSLSLIPRLSVDTWCNIMQILGAV